MTSRHPHLSRLSRRRRLANCLPEALEKRQFFSVSTPELVSVGLNGAAGNGESGESSVSADGRYVVFSSTSSNLVDGDTNGKQDIFLRDTVADTTVLISKNSTTGAIGNGLSNQPIINQDGTYVAFASKASNLVDGDTGGFADIFRYNIATQQLQLVSAINTAGTAFAGAGSSEPTISKDGSLVSFTSFASNFPGVVDGNPANDVYVRNMGSTAQFGIAAGATKLVSTKKSTTNVAGNNISFDSAISADGRYITFRSDASDLVDNDTNVQRDTFLRDLQTGAATIISVNTQGGSGNAASDSNSVSGDGRYVAFQSRATDLVTNDNNGTADIFLRDTLSNTTTLLTINRFGTASAAGTSAFPALSQDGSYASFSSTASDIIPNDTNAREDVFLRDLARGPLTVVSVNSAGNPSNGVSNDSFLSLDGKKISFTSTATDISTATATGGHANIYVSTVTPPDTVTDTTPPTAVFGVLEPANSTDTSARFTVNLADNAALNTVYPSKNPSILPTVTRTDGATGTVTLVSVVGTGTNAVATYSVSFGGTTLDQNVGSYTVAIANNVFPDVAGNFAAAGTIGTFALSSSAGSGGGTSGGGTGGTDGGSTSGGGDGAGGTATLGDPNGPNFIISKIGKVPSTAIGSITKAKLKFTVKNTGPGIMTTKVTTQFAAYLSADTTVDASDVLLGTTTIKNLKLKLNKTKSGTLKWTYPAGIGDGNYFVVIKADSGSVISESSETDNTAPTVSTVLVQQPFVDLTTVAPAKISGTTATKKSSVKVNLENLGNVKFKGTVVVRLVDVASGSVLDPVNDLDITNPISVKLDISAKKKKSTTLKFVFPTLAAGVHSVGVIIDSTNVVGESDESNNTIQTAEFSV